MFPYLCPYTLYTRWRQRVWLMTAREDFSLNRVKKSMYVNSVKLNLSFVEKLIIILIEVQGHFFRFSSLSFFGRIWRRKKNKQIINKTSFSLTRISTEEALEKVFFFCFVTNANSFICLSLSDDEFWKRVSAQDIRIWVFAILKLHKNERKIIIKTTSELISFQSLFTADRFVSSSASTCHISQLQHPSKEAPEAMNFN